MLDPSMNWRDVAGMLQQWGDKFCLKGVLSVEDARRAVGIGCSGIVVSNHCGLPLVSYRSRIYHGRSAKNWPKQRLRRSTEDFEHAYSKASLPLKRGREEQRL